MRFWRNTTVATPGRRRHRDAAATARSATSGTRTPTTASGRPARSACRRRRSPSVAGAARTTARPSAPAPSTHNLTLYRAPSGALRLRRRHRAVVVGPRRDPRPRQRRRRRAHAAGDRQPVRRHGRAAEHAAVRPGRRDGVDRRHRADVDDHRRRRSGAAVSSRQPGHDHRHGDRHRAAAWSAASKCRPTAARPGRAPTGRGTWTYTLDGRRHRERHDPQPRGRRQRQPGDARAGRHGHHRQRQPARARAASGAPAARPPAPAETTDNAAVELGVKFRADVAGYITGVRFYKGATNTGTHVGTCGAGTGTLLATGDVHRRDGVRLAAGALRHAGRDHGRTRPTSPRTTRRAGNYAEQPRLLRRGRVDSAPLHALRDGEDGGNGLYRYGPSGTFPNGVYRSENYWVDVVFEQARRRRTPPPPTVGTVAPARGATGVAATANVTALQRGDERDDGQRDAASCCATASGAAVPGGRQLRRRSRTATLDPTASLTADTTYTATVKGGRRRREGPRRQRARDRRHWTFTTRAAAARRAARAASGRRPARPARRPRATTPRSRSARSSAPTSTASSPACASTRAPTNTGTHVGPPVDDTGQLLATATFAQRDGVRLAAGELRHAGRDHGEHHLRRSPTTRRAGTTP